MGRNLRGALALLVFALLLSGCWDHRPPEESAFILSIGLDLAPDDDTQVVVTQLVVIPSGVAAGSEKTGSQGGTPFHLISSKATTLEAAQAGAFQKLSRIPSLAHLDALMFGHDFARDGRGVEPAVSWAVRHPEIRLGTFLFVVDKSGQYFLDAQPVLDPLPGEAIAGLMDQADRVSFVYPVRLFEFARGLLSPRTDVALPYVGRVDPVTNHVPPDFRPQPFLGSPGENAPLDTQIQLMGMAIFKGPRMIGLLTERDGSGLRWIYGGAKSTLSIPHPEVPGAYIVGNTVRSSTKRSAKLDGDRLILTIEISASMDAWGLATLQPMLLDKHLEAVNRGFAESIETHVRRTMERLQEFKADIFGFGEELYRSSPEDWQKVAPVWDDVYAAAELDIHIDVMLRRTGFSR